MIYISGNLDFLNNILKKNNKCSIDGTCRNRQACICIAGTAFYNINVISIYECSVAVSISFIWNTS